jgi:folate-binding protein YgfZ
MQSSPLRTLHAEAGAQLAAPGAPLVTVTYGDVPAEYEAARSGALLFDVSERGLVRLGGNDTEAFLHRILANRVKGLAVGTGNPNLLLSGKGKVVHTFDLVHTGEVSFEASTPPGDAARLVQSLERYLFTEDTTLIDATDEHAPLELVGPDAPACVERVLGARSLPLPDGAGGHRWMECTSTEHGRVCVTSLSVAGVPGLRLEPEPKACATLWRALLSVGATPGGLVAWDALRAEHVVGVFGRDVTEDVYPQEARLEAAFSLEKGCYIGQEVVAKIDTYGGLNKRLMLLRVGHDDPVEPGTRLVVREGAEARDLGLVTTWAYSFAHDCGVVLAYVKRKHQDVGRVFDLVPPGGDQGIGTATILGAGEAHNPSRSR